jgi:protein-disulfide isomerase
MIPKLRRVALPALAVAASLTAGSLAIAQLAPGSRAEFENLIKEYLLANPALIDEVIAKSARLRATAEAEKRKAALVENATAIFSSARQVTLGDPQGTTTLVEFFDYNCGFCKRALPNKLELMKNDPKLKVVLKELPVLGKNSIDAAKVAVAVRMQDPAGVKYLDFHQRLLLGATADHARALAAAKEAGLDMARLEKDLASEEINATLEEGKQLAALLGIRGTPTYVIGDEIVAGAVALPVLQEKLQRARK